MFQTVNEIPDEIKNIVELFYVRDAEIARAEAQRLKESNPELKNTINDVLRLFENAPDSVYLFYDKLNALYAQSDILDDSFADFSLSDLPNDSDEEVPKTDSGLIDVSNLQEPMEAEESEEVKDDNPLPQSLSLLDDEDLPLLGIGQSLPESNPKPKKPEKNTLQLGGDFDLNIELDFDLNGPDLDVADIISGLDNKENASKVESGKDKFEKSKRTLNWGTSGFDIFNDNGNAPKQQIESDSSNQSSSIPQQKEDDEAFGQPLLSNEQVSARLAEISNLQQSALKDEQKAEEVPNKEETENIENVDFFAGADEVKPTDDIENVDFFAGADEVKPTDDIDNVDFFAGADEVKPTEDIENVDFFAGAEEVKPTEDIENADFFGGVEEVKPTEDIENVDFFAGAEEVKPTEDIENADFFANPEESDATLENDTVDAYAEVQDSESFEEADLSENSVNAVVDEIDFPQWDAQFLADESLGNQRETIASPKESIPEPNRGHSEFEQSSGLGERITRQEGPQIESVPQLGFRSVPEIPSQNTRTPVPGELNRDTEELQFDVDAFALNGVRRSSGNYARVQSSDEWSNSRKTSPSSLNVQQDRQSFMQVLENEKALSPKIEETEIGTTRRRPNTMWGFQKKNNNALDEKFVSPTALNLTPIAPMDKIQSDQVTSEALTPVPPAATETPKPTNVSLTPISIEPDPHPHTPEDGQLALENLKPYSRIPQLTCSMQELLKRSDINSRAGFLLSMIDGNTSISDIFDLSMFPEPETAFELAKLETEGVIVFT